MASGSPEGRDVCGAGLGRPVQRNSFPENVSFGGGTFRLKNFFYRTREARLSSFAERGWPPSMPQTPAQLAEAGFYYAGNGDEVLCFSCDGGLRNWEPHDDPWTEHAKWFDQCPFLVLSKSPEFIREAKSSSPGALPEEPAAAPPPEAPLRERGAIAETAAAPAQDEESFRDVLAENERLRDERSCRVCLEHEKTVLFLPCRHLATCLTCASLLQTCPVCRSPIDSHVKIFSA